MQTNYGTTYKGDICINLSSSKNGTYEPYTEHTYPLSDIELRGVPKLVNNELQYDGDTYASDGTVTRRFGYVEFDGSSDENWKIESGSTYGVNFYIALPTPTRGSISVVRTNFVACKSDDTLSLSRDTCYVSAGGNLNVTCGTTLGVSTVAAWRTYLVSRPLQVVYLLATPSTETADAYTNPQVSGTTEEYIDTRTVPMPVGHSTQYFDMVQMEKIQMHMPTVQPIKMHMPIA